MPFPPPHDIVFPNGFRRLHTRTISYRLPAGLESDLRTRSRDGPGCEDQLCRIKRHRLAPRMGTKSGYLHTGTFDSFEHRQRRPYSPAFTSIEVVDSVSGSDFNSLQLSLDKRFGRGFTFMANYTWAKSIDYGSGGGTLWPDFTDPWNHTIDRGLSDFDRRHGLSLPGFGRCPLARAIRAGAQLHWWLGSCRCAYATIRPSLLRSKWSGQFVFRRWARSRRSCRGYQPPGRSRSRSGVVQHGGVCPKRARHFREFGTEIIVPGPGLANVNMALSKSFTIYRESSIQFRAEFFNLTNHP